MTGKRIIILALVAGLAGPVLADDVPVPRTYTEAQSWYERAAEAGKPEAQFLWATMLEQGLRGLAPDPAVAARWYRKAAEQGHAGAQYRLAVLYYEGRGVVADRLKAAQWFAQAAEAGIPEAQYDYALLLERGRGPAADAGEAAAWYGRAYESGVAGAAANLAALYARGGPGLAADPVHALVWLRLAEQAGLPAPPSFRQSLLRSLDAEQRAEAERLLQARRRTPRKP